MIPPGIHFIYFSVADKYGHLGMRNGFFHNFKLKEIVAKKWNNQTESIDDYLYSSAELTAFSDNKREFDRFLGPYPYDEYKRWISLANNLNEQYLLKLMPASKIISSGSILIGQPYCTTKAKESMKLDVIHEDEAQLADELAKHQAKADLFVVPASLEEAEKRLPEMEQVKSEQIHFSKMPTQAYPMGCTPAEITKHCIDKSYRLDLLIAQQQCELNDSAPNPLHLMCELQFSFICFLIGQVYDAFEQWKALISLLCNSEQAIHRYPSLYIQLIQVVFFQLKEMPQDFFTDIITSNNFLVVNLHNLFNNIRTSCELTHNHAGGNEQAALIKTLNEKCNKFKNFLEEKFKFDFDMEPDEYRPVVCDEAS